MMSQAQNILAMSYQYHGDHETSMAHYLEALRLNEAHKNTFGIAATLTNIGAVYYDSRNVEKAAEYFKSALALYESVNEQALVAQLLGNLANAYSDLGQSDDAQELYQRAINIATALDDADQLGYLRQNMAEDYLAAGDYEQALALQRKGLLTVPGAGSWERSRSWQSMAATYLGWGKLDSAHHYATLSYKTALADRYQPDVVVAAELLYKIAELRDQPDTALRYFKVFKAYEDSIDLDDTQNAVQLLEAKHLLENSEAAVAEQADLLKLAAAERELAVFTRNALIGLVILLLLIGGITAFWLQSRKRAAVAEKALLALQLQQEEHAKKLLRDELDFLNQSLVSYSVLLAQKNAILADLKEQLAADAIAGQMQPLVRSINAGLSFEDEWEQFKLVFQRVHPDFFARIKERYPELTANELRLCALLKLNMSSKQIGSLLNIEPRSVDKNRYRVRKKLDLAAEENLQAFVDAL